MTVTQITSNTAFVFNGDADGLCAQQMLFLSGIRPSLRISGVKRDLALLKNIAPPYPEKIFGLDLNFGDNHEAALELLQSGVSIHWIDHHQPGPLPSHPAFFPTINDSKSMCTAILTRQTFYAEAIQWAACGAYGDNLQSQANTLARQAGLTESQCKVLQEIGELLNYNAYGESVSDLMIAPLELAVLLEKFLQPLDFAQETTVIPDLREQFKEDQSHCISMPALVETHSLVVYQFPPASWAHRFASTFINQRVSREPEKAFVALMENSQHDFVVSLRAPKHGRISAADFARRYPSGGGRVLAAGINHLAAADLSQFMLEMRGYFEKS